ncbi:hypothetical protein ID866_11129, partial [Astraeus odoratus]
MVSVATTNWTQICVVAAICSFTLDLVYRLTRRQKGKDIPLPPGPIALPVVGNVLAINKGAPWLTYTEWATAYGDLVYTRLFNEELLLVNSLDSARVLFEKRSNIYSDRPQMATYALFGLDATTIFLPYGERWRLHRRLFQLAFKPKAIPRYWSMQQNRANQMLLNILATPNDCFAHFQTYSSSIIMSSAYDYETEPREDPLVDLIDKALKLATSSIRPDIVVISRVFPALLKLPSWTPGMGILKKAAQSRVYVRDWMEVPFQYVLKKMADGTAGSSMVVDALLRENVGDIEYYTRAVKETAATSFGAGSETTSSMLRVFMLAMVLFPEVQEKAQREIDNIIGTSRLPTMEDRPSLKYIDAVLREALRWHPVLPLAVPHATTTEDMYQGFLIPKGATIVANVWAISRDEKRYPEPERFHPERFLDQNGDLNEDTVAYVFGFGRRLAEFVLAAISQKRLF